MHHHARLHPHHRWLLRGHPCCHGLRDGDVHVRDGRPLDELEVLDDEEAGVAVAEVVFVLLADEPPARVLAVERQLAERDRDLADDVVLAAAVPVPDGDLQPPVEPAAVDDGQQDLLERRVAVVHVLLGAVDDLLVHALDGDERVGLREEVARREVLAPERELRLHEGKLVVRRDGRGRRGDHLQRAGVLVEQHALPLRVDDGDDRALDHQVAQRRLARADEVVRAVLVVVVHLDGERAVRTAAEPRLQDERLPLGVQRAHAGLALVDEHGRAGDADVLGRLARLGGLLLRVPRHGGAPVPAVRVVHLRAPVDHKVRVGLAVEVLAVHVLALDRERDALGVLRRHRELLGGEHGEAPRVLVERAPALLHVDQLVLDPHLADHVRERRAELADEVVLAVLVPVVHLHHDRRVQPAALHGVDLERLPLGVDVLLHDGALPAHGVLHVPDDDVRVRRRSESFDPRAVLHQRRVVCESGDQSCGVACGMQRRKIPRRDKNCKERNRQN